MSQASLELSMKPRMTLFLPFSLTSAGCWDSRCGLSLAVYVVLEISTPTEPHSSPQMNTYFKMQQGSGGGAFNTNTREAKAGGSLRSSLALSIK